MKDGATAKKVSIAPTEYPYESFYRPWSWILSSVFNIFLLAAIVGILYLLYRSRMRRRAKRTVTYRTVEGSRGARKPDQLSALVTGGNGGLGREIVQALLANGHYAVHSLDILLPEEEDRRDGVCSYIQADVTDCNALLIAFKEVDVVFHCASITPVTVRHTPTDYHRVNVTGTENVIQACRECRVKRLIYTSSASVTLGRDQQTACDADETHLIPSLPLNAYVASKGEADKLVRAANSELSLQTCVLRPNLFVQTIFAALEELPYCVNLKDFEVSVVPVECVARAHLLAEKKLLEGGSTSVAAGKAYNISDQKITIPEMADFIASEKNATVTFIPFSLVYFLAWINEVIYRYTGVVSISESLSTTSMGYKTHTYVSDLARRELGWGPSTPWKDVVRQLLKKREGNKKDN